MGQQTDHGRSNRQPDAQRGTGLDRGPAACALSDAQGSKILRGAARSTVSFGMMVLGREDIDRGKICKDMTRIDKLAQQAR